MLSTLQVSHVPVHWADLMHGTEKNGFNNNAIGTVPDKR